MTDDAATEAMPALTRALCALHPAHYEASCAHNWPGMGPVYLHPLDDTLGRPRVKAREMGPFWAWWQCDVALLSTFEREAQDAPLNDFAAWLAAQDRWFVARTLAGLECP